MAKFKSNYVDGKMLSELNEELLSEMDIKQKMVQKRILSEIGRLILSAGLFDAHGLHLVFMGIRSVLNVATDRHVHVPAFVHIVVQRLVFVT